MFCSSGLHSSSKIIYKFFNHLLESLFEFVEIDGRVVTHDADGSKFLESLEVGPLDTLSLEENIADGLVRRPGDLELEERAVRAFDLLKDEHPGDGHLVCGEGAGLVGADDRRAAEGFDGGQRADDGVLLGHTPRTQGQASGDDSGQTFRDGSHGQGDGDFEVVDGTLNKKKRWSWSNPNRLRLFLFKSHQRINTKRLFEIFGLNRLKSP